MLINDYFTHKHTRKFVFVWLVVTLLVMFFLTGKRKLSLRDKFFYREGILSSVRVLTSVTFWSESGSADMYLCLTDPDPYKKNAFFVSDLQDGNQQNFFFFFCLLLFKLHLLDFSKIKSHKEVTKQYESRFFSGSVPRSERPKNIRILRIRLWIRNTGTYIYFQFYLWLGKLCALHNWHYKIL